MSEHGTGTTLERRAGEPRPPTLLDALLPVCVLIGVIALTISLFGVSATDGPLQVALLLTAFASLIAFKNGYSPILDVLYGFLGFKVASRTPTPNGRVEKSSAEAALTPP